MPITFRTAGAAIAAATAALILGSCGEETGEALPGATQTYSTTTSPPTTTQGGSQLAKINACDLLTDEEAATIGKGLEKEDLGAFGGATDVCEWSTSVDSGVPIDKGITFGISIRPSQTVADVTVEGEAKVTDGDVSGRTAKLVAENASAEGACMLSFAAEDGRVDIIAESYDTEQSCAAIDDVSTIIEPRLPK